MRDPAEPTPVQLALVVTRSDIAARLGTTPQAVSNWRRRGLGFPPPLGRVGPLEVWWWPTVRRWAEDTARIWPPGRPR